MEVAAVAGPPFPAVLEQPYALTLWTYFQIVERERIRMVRRRIRETDNAVLTALAFNEPKKLAEEQQAARDVARQSPATKAVANDEWQAARDRLVAAIDHGKLLDDSPTLGLNA